MNAKCGTCGKTHDTILDYRDCAGARTEDESAVDVMDKLTGPSTINPPSDKQVEYVLDLLKVRAWPDSYTSEQLKGMERRQVSQIIDSILKAPVKTEEFHPEIPDGFYALRQGDHWTFWEVSNPTRGKWVGFAFATKLIGSPGDYRREKTSKAVGNGVLAMIKEIKPAVASSDFGRQSGHCGICHSPLTNKDSLDRGIGPICASKMGW